MAIGTEMAAVLRKEASSPGANSQSSGASQFEVGIRELTKPINGQLPRPWMTRMKDPFRARVFVVGMNQSREYPAGQISHERHLDALFNRNGETCRGLYDLVTKGKASRTRRNIDQLTDRLNRQGVQDVLETDVICYSTRMSRDLRNRSHAGGARKGDEIFRYLLEQIMPPVLIVHGMGAGRRVAAILGIDLPKIPQNADEVFEIQTDGHLIIPIPSLSPPAFNLWSAWSGELTDRVAALVKDKLSRPS